MKLHEFIKLIKRELVLSLIITLTAIILLLSIGFYDSFEYFEESLKPMIICFIGGFIGLLGFSLSGIAIITGMLNKENISCINRKDGENMDKILYTYQMLTKVILAIIFTLFCVFIAISSPAAKIPKVIFLAVLFYVLYICIFGIVYTRELVTLTIRIYKIKNANDTMVINEVKSSDIDEIRIDILMRIIMQTHNISLQDMMEEMKNAINNSEYKNKDELIKYINKKYGK